MARQQKSAQPKQKFLRPCMECGEQPQRVVINGILVIKCGCH